MAIKFILQVTGTLLLAISALLLLFSLSFFDFTDHPGIIKPLLICLLLAVSMLLFWIAKKVVSLKEQYTPAHMLYSPSHTANSSEAGFQKSAVTPWPEEIDKAGRTVEQTAPATLLRLMQQEKENILNRINDSVVSVDKDWRYTFLNDAALTQHPSGIAGTLGKVIWDVHPEMRGTNLWDSYHQAMETGKVIRLETFYAPMQTWFSVKLYPSPEGLTIFYSDITEQKNAAEKIRLNEQRLIKAQQIGKFGYWHQDINSQMIWASRQAQTIYGFSGEVEELPAASIAACIIDLPLVQQAAVRLIEHNEPYNIEFWIRPADGSALKYIAALAEVERNENNEAVRLLGTLQDITQRKRAKEEIIKEKKLSDSIINSLPGIFYLYNKGGKFLRWNKNFEKVTMYSAPEISQMHPLDFYDDNEKDLVADKITNTFKLGEDAVQTDFLLKSKEKIPYYFTGRAIEYEGQECLLGVGIDYSERAKARQEIEQTTQKLRALTEHLQKVREEERKKIGREIHDELGQQLTAINMDVAWIDKKIPDDNIPVKTKLKNIIQLLNGSNQSVRRILNELRPMLLDDYGLVDAVVRLTRQFTDKTGIPVKFTGSDIEINAPEAVANCIFRAYQEAFTNITRYARASHVFTSIGKADNALLIVIEDDGNGFDVEAVQMGKSFGILGMKERVISLGGTFEIDSNPGKGTKISLRVPLQNQPAT